MSSQRTTAAIRSGNPIRRSANPRSTTYIRTDARIERLVSVDSGDNSTINEWLITASRANPTLKTARNLGGLSLTLVESRALTPALMKKYADYGKYIGMTSMHQKDLSERFSNFVTQQGWQNGLTHLGNNLIFLGPKKGAQLGAVCFGVNEKSVVEQHKEAIDYLVYEEGLDLHPKNDFIPHLTIDTARYKDMQILRLPQIPGRIALDAPQLSTFASTARR